jgi:phage tail-like protein
VTSKAPLIGQALEPIPLVLGEVYAEHTYRVFVEGRYAGEFIAAGPLNKAKVDLLRMQAGGGIVVETVSPGRAEFESLTLSQGVSSNTLLRDWFAQTVAAGGVAGELPAGCRKTVRIDQIDRQGQQVESYTFPDCVIESFDGGKFDAKSGEFRITQVVLS